MKKEALIKLALGLILALLVIGFFRGVFPLQPAIAEKSGDTVGRYQISAWAAQTGTAGYHHAGYYVVDTMTGKIVDKGYEVHSVKE